MVRFEPRDDCDVSIVSAGPTGLSIPEEFIEVRSSNAGKVAELEVEIRPGVPAGPIRGELVVTLDHPVVKTEEVQLSGLVR